MSKPPIITRRSLLAGFWLASVSSAWAQVRGGRSGDDQGIGGTGAARIGDDHGIGGTGIVGVIQRFGSIFVNGERIGYAPDVPVRINGEAASVKALRIGHVARVVAVRQANGALTTRGISAVSEVIGPIQSVGAGEMSVLGQRVTFTGRETWRPGTYVAVSGLAPNRRRHRRQPRREATRQCHASHRIAGARSRRGADRWLASCRCGSGADRSARSR